MYKILTEVKTAMGINIPTGAVAEFKPHFDFGQKLSVPFEYRFYLSREALEAKESQIPVIRPSSITEEKPRGEVYTCDVKEYSQEDYNILTNAKIVSDLLELLSAEFGEGNVVWES